MRTLSPNLMRFLARPFSVWWSYTLSLHSALPALAPLGGGGRIGGLAGFFDAVRCAIRQLNDLFQFEMNARSERAVWWRINARRTRGDEPNARLVRFIRESSNGFE